MEDVMTRLVRIGNSQGVRIPKAIIEQTQLEDKELEFKVTDNGLLIKPVKRPRQGWKEQFDKAGYSMEVDDGMDLEWLDAPLVDDGAWEW